MDWSNLPTHTTRAHYHQCGFWSQNETSEIQFPRHRYEKWKDNSSDCEFIRSSKQFFPFAWISCFSCMESMVGSSAWNWWSWRWWISKHAMRWSWPRFDSSHSIARHRFRGESNTPGEHYSAFNFPEFIVFSSHSFFFRFIIFKIRMWSPLSYVTRFFYFHFIFLLLWFIFILNWFLFFLPFRFLFLMFSVSIYYCHWTKIKIHSWQI